MKDLTYIKVKERKFWASDYKKLEDYNLRLLKKDKNYGDYKFFSGKSDAEIKLEYDKDLEAFNQSFIEVGNPEFMHQLLPVKGAELVEGIQPVSGLQFEVREQYYHEYDDEWYDSGGLQFSKMRKVAILSLKQEQPSEEKGMDVLKIYRFQAKQIEDTFRLVQRIFECDKKESSVDRDVMQSWQMIKNVLEGKIDEHVPRT